MKQRKEFVKEETKDACMTEKDTAILIFVKVSLYKPHCLLSTLSLAEMNWSTNQFVVPTIENLHLLLVVSFKRLIKNTVLCLSSSEKSIVGLNEIK